MNLTSRRRSSKNSVFCKNINTVACILFGKVFIFSRFCSFPFRKCITLPSLSDIDILRDSFGFKSFNQIGNRRSFQLIEKQIFWPEEVGGGLATGWFTLVANFAPHFFGWKLARRYLTGNFLMQGFDATCEQTEKTFSFSRY